MPRNALPSLGDVWLVSLDPAVGHEVQKTRPAVIVTSNIYNRHNWVVVVMPLTFHKTAEYDQILIKPPEGGATSTSVTLPEQIRTVDCRRLVKRLGRVNRDTLRSIDRSLKIVLDLWQGEEITLTNCSRHTPCAVRCLRHTACAAYIEIGKVISSLRLW